MLENFFISIPLGLFGVVVLFLSAEWVVGKLIALAHHFGVSDTFIGLTVLSVGTSLPEIGSHVAASVGILNGTLDYKIASSTVLGANIGSDVIQQTLILGLVVLLAGGMTFSKKFLKNSYSVMIATTLLTLILGWDGQISRLDGCILLGAMAGYMYFLYRTEKEHPLPKRTLDNHPYLEIVFVVVGLGLILASSTLVLLVVEEIVKVTSLGGSLIGVITLGIASALPEFITAISGLRSKAQGISLGTLIGSNITNPLLAIGLGGLISTYYVPRPLVLWDLPMETITAALLALYLFMRKGRLGKIGAVYLILLYAVYLYVRVVYFPFD